MEIDEQEFECENKNNDKCLSPSFKSNPEGSDINKKNSLIDNENNNINKSSLPKININLDNDSDNKNNCNNIFNFTDKIYSKDEHFKKLIFNKKMCSQNNLINLKKFLSVEYTRNFDKKSATSKFDNDAKNQRKSLFHGARNKLEEEKGTINLTVNNKCNRSNRSNRSNRPSVCSKCSNQKKYESNKYNKFAAFLKLHAKPKKPPKVLYMDSVINKSNNLKIDNDNDNSFIRKENKFQTIKSINTAKSMNKNIIFTKTVVDEINKKDIEEELIHNKTKNNSVTKIEEKKNQYQNSKYNEKTKKEKHFERKKCFPFQLFCCLNYGLK